MNIKDHDFFDDDLSYCHDTPGEIYFDIKCEVPTVMLNKDDVIALAKHFKLTADDLQGQ